MFSFVIYFKTPLIFTKMCLNSIKLFLKCFFWVLLLNYSSKYNNLKWLKMYCTTFVITHCPPAKRFYLIVVWSHFAVAFSINANSEHHLSSLENKHIQGQDVKCYSSWCQIENLPVSVWEDNLMSQAMKMPRNDSAICPLRSLSI